MNVDAVASASIDMSLATVQVESTASILKKTMDFQKETAQTLIQDMMPAFGHIMDIRI